MYNIKYENIKKKQMFFIKQPTSCLCVHLQVGAHMRLKLILMLFNNK